MEEQSPIQFDLFGEKIIPPLSQKERQKQEKQRKAQENKKLEEQAKIEKALKQEEAKKLEHQKASSGAIIPLESDALSGTLKQVEYVHPPILPSRWEDARDAAIKRNALQVLLKQMSVVGPPLEYLRYLVSVATDEGMAWVMYGESGSGKSSFLNTLEYQTNNEIRTHIIGGDSLGVDLTNHIKFAAYLKEVILTHQETHGITVPLIIVLEQRETDMSEEERRSIAQALRNTLRSPGPGKNVIFVLPVTNASHGDLFLKQVRDTGVFVPTGQNTIYTFYGPQHTEHVDIISSLCIALNDRDITEYGFERADLQKSVSSQQTIGQYIRLIKEQTVARNKQFLKIIRNNSYRPFTVITCFVSPFPGNKTEPIIRAMTLDAFGKIRTSELLRATQSQNAQTWKGKHQALQNIMEALDMRIVEISPEIIVKLLFAYGYKLQEPSDQEGPEGILAVIKKRIVRDGITYHEPKSVRQNLIQQLRASNLFHIIAGEETGGYTSSRQDEGADYTAKTDITLTKYVCEVSHDYQHTLHGMFAQALKELLGHSTKMSSLADFRNVYPEPHLTLTDTQGIPQKILRPDVVIEMHDKLFLLEFCWRSADHFTYADIASYVLRKIHDAYLHLPLVKALEAGSIQTD